MHDHCPTAGPSLTTDVDNKSERDTARGPPAVIEPGPNLFTTPSLRSLRAGAPRYRTYDVELWDPTAFTLSATPYSVSRGGEVIPACHRRSIWSNPPAVVSDRFFKFAGRLEPLKRAGRAREGVTLR